MVAQLSYSYFILGAGGDNFLPSLVFLSAIWELKTVTLSIFVNRELSVFLTSLSSTDECISLMMEIKSWPQVGPVT